MRRASPPRIATAPANLVWQTLVDTVDITALLADLALRRALALRSELAERLRLKILPGSPGTIDATELFTLALPEALMPRRLAACPPTC